MVRMTAYLQQVEKEITVDGHIEDWKLMRAEDISNSL